MQKSRRMAIHEKKTQHNIQQSTIERKSGYVEAEGIELRGREKPEGMMNNKWVNEGETYIS